MNELQVFDFRGNEVRTVMIDNNPWWVAKDVCDVLHLSNPTEAVKNLNSDDLSLTEVIDSLGRKQKVNIINESGLYTLIIRSDKPEAKEFQRWITKEVIPSIRKTGTYALKQLSPAEILLAQAQALVEQERQIKAVSTRVDYIEQRLPALREIPVLQPLTQRSQLNQLVNAYARAHSIDHQSAWHELHNAAYYRLHINITAKAKNAKMRKLDYIEQNGLLPQYLALVTEMLAN